MLVKTVLIRVSDILREWIEEEAADNDRTMSAECRRILEAERQKRLRERQQPLQYISQEAHP